MKFRVTPTRSRVNRFLAMLAGAAVLILATPMGHANSFPISFNWTQTYPNSSSLANVSDDGCALCHDQVTPTKQNMPIVNNGYGVALQEDPNIKTNPVAAFQALESLNSDGDPGGYTNREEIDASTQPGWTEEDPNIPSSVGDPLDPEDGENEPPAVSEPDDQANNETDDVNLQIVATDPDEDPLTYSALALPPGLTIDANTGLISGEVSQDAVPHPDIFPADPVGYNVEISVDDGVNDDPVTVIFTWTISDLNRDPVALDDSASTLDSTAVVVLVLANDGDADNDSLTVSDVTNPTDGTASANPDGTITYTPVENIGNYVASFDYTIADGFGGSATATVEVNVTGENDPPQVTAPSAQEDSEDDTVALQIEATDPENDTLTYSATGLPDDLSIDLDSGLISGTVSFDAVVHTAIQDDTYTVTVEVSDGVNQPVSATFDWTINDVNREPSAVNDGPFETVHDTPITIDVLDNDSDPDEDTLTVAGITNHPAHGSVDINQDNTLTYTPDAGFVGDDPFTYSIEDGFEGTAEATVVLSVSNQPPVAYGDVYGTDQVTPLLVSIPGVLENDTDEDPGDQEALTADLVSGPTIGTLNYLDPDGSFSYTPVDTGADYTDTFTYVANDSIEDSNEATVTINVTETETDEAPEVADPGDQTNEENDPVNLTIIATDPDEDTLAYSADVLPAGLSIDPISGVISGVLSFEEVDHDHPNLSKTTTVTITASDGDLTGSVTFDWIVNDVNRDPVALDDGSSIDHDTPITIEVLANDSDADDDPLTVVNILVPPLNGTAVINNDNTVTYTPNPGFASSDNFVYEIDDDFGGSASATVTVSVDNTPPVAYDDDYEAVENTPLAVNTTDGVLANDTDADGDQLTAAEASIPANGTLDLAEDGSFLYTPNADFAGGDSFTYLAYDGIADSNEATVTITVHEADNLLPVADAGGPYPGVVGEEVQFDGTGSYDPDGNLLSYDWDFGDGGTSSHPTPTHTYDAADTYTVSLTVTDADGGFHTDETEALIDPQNEPPVAADDSHNTPQDTELVIPAPGVLGNDSDADGDPLTAALESAPANGTVSLNPDGSFTYTPNGGFFGEDSFAYVANDGQDDSNVATVTIEVIEEVEVDEPPKVEQPADQSDDEGSSVSLTINASDPNGDPLTFSAIGLPPNLSIDPGNGEISGIISFDAVDHPDLIPDSYPVTVTVSDGELSTSVSFNWNVADVNRDPVAMDDSSTTPLDTPVTVDVIANDTDDDGDALSVAGVGTPANGTAVNNDDGTVTYTPSAGFAGTDSFTYTIEDGISGSSSAIVSILVEKDGSGDADVFLTRIRAPRQLSIRVDSETERKITVFGDGDTISQFATVVLTAEAPDGVEVEIEPVKVTKKVRPGGRNTRFRFEVEVECKKQGRYDVWWIATIDADQNSDPTNDVRRAKTAVNCRGGKKHDKGDRRNKADDHDHDHDD